MALKKPPLLTSIPCSTFCIHSGEYRIDREYQREEGTWKRPDKQYFIDTVLRGYGMPPIFIHKKDGKEYIVDGQQRFNTIIRFFNNKLDLGEQYSIDLIKTNGGARKYNQLKTTFQRDRFDAYPVPVIYLEDYDDEEIRSEFRRLNAGKPLNIGERLNAYPGNIVPTMRSIGKHRFFNEILPFKSQRYKNLHIAAILMLLESKGITDISPKYVYEFFEEREKGIDPSTINKIQYTLNYLCDMFKEKTGELREAVWIFTVYLVVSHLLERYVIQTNSRRKRLKKFLVDFYDRVYSTARGKDKDLDNFFDAATSGTTSAKNIQTRVHAMLRKLLRKMTLTPFDEKRIFTYQQKLRIFRKFKGKCQVCKKRLEFKSPKTHFHHKDLYSMGGKTELKKGLLVCSDCHMKKIHGKTATTVA